MVDDYSLLIKMVMSNELGESVPAIDKLVEMIDESTTAFLKAIEQQKDRFAITEHVSMIFEGYKRKLLSYLDHNDKDLVFWIASLIVHYEIKNEKAEAILINAVDLGTPDHLYVAATILCRVKNPLLKDVVSRRLKRSDIDDKQRKYFEEILSCL